MNAIATDDAVEILQGLSNKDLFYALRDVFSTRKIEKWEECADEFGNPSRDAVLAVIKKVLE